MLVKPDRPIPDLRPWFEVLADVIDRGANAWNSLFEKSQPVEVDVGCGRGLFLWQSCRKHPERNFVGIDVDYHEARRAAARLKRHQFTNGRVLGGDVTDLFTKLVPAGSLDAVHVYFPDPWWKRRHRRRRVFTVEFLDRAARVLKPGGLLHSWTDVPEYWEVIQNLVNHHEEFQALAPPGETPATSDLDYSTGYERKRRKAGLPIYRGLWQRV